jgi:2-methylcitrate dehydratase PrpD
MVAGLGTRFFVTESAIKTFSVGYPIQAPLDAILTLRRQHNLTPANVEHILVRLPTDGANIVNNSAMPDVNCQHLVSVALARGAVSFEDSHSRPLMQDPMILAIKRKVELVGDRALMDPEAPRSGFVEVTMTGGRKVNHFTRHPPGTKENPLDTAGVNAKVRDLMAPVLGTQKTEALITQINTLEALDDIRKLRPLLIA